MKNGRPVGAFRVTGVLAEEVLVLMQRLGASGVETKHLPSCVSMRLDRRGLRRVQVYEQDRVRALAVAKLVRVELHRRGLGVLRVVVRAEGRDGAGEHDLVLEVVDDFRGRVWKLISAELRLRQLWSERGREKVRDIFEEECVDCGWWQEEEASGKWSGRLIILAEFPQQYQISSGFILRADYYPVGGGRVGFFGWRGSHGTLPAPVVPKPVVAKVVYVKPQKKPFEEVVSKLAFRTERSGRVASVAQLLQTMGLDTRHIGRRMAAWMARCPGEVASFTTTRRTGKRGGSPEWVTTKKLLEVIYNAV